MNTVKNEREILEAFRENPDMMAILTCHPKLGVDRFLVGSRFCQKIFIWNLLSDKSSFDVKQM